MDRRGFLASLTSAALLAAARVFPASGKVDVERVEIAKSERVLVVTGYVTDWARDRIDLAVPIVMDMEPGEQPWETATRHLRFQSCPWIQGYTMARAEADEFMDQFAPRTPLWVNASA